MFASKPLPISPEVPSALSHKQWIAQSTPITPTEQTYLELQNAYSLFNRQFFNARLPNCLITFQRCPRTLGYFCSQRFVNRDGSRSDEIALNPRYFAARTDVGVLSTLAHEMAHLSQFHFGKRGRMGYHCREWADRMISIGLQPSNTGRPGGRQTGYQMTHFIIEHGPFDILTHELIDDGFRLSWLETDVPVADLAPVKAPPSPENSDGSHRWKYTCPTCGFNAWAKPHAPVGCWRCQVAMPRNIKETRLIEGA